MMHHRRSLFAALFLITALLTSAWAVDVQEQLKKLEMDRADANVKSDVAMLDKQTSDDYVLINLNGGTAGKAEMLEGFKSGRTKITTDDLSDLKVRVYGNTAIITGKADVKGTLGGADITGQIMFTRVYVKKDGRWQCVSLQQTRMATP